MSESRQAYWERVYARQGEDKVSWFEPHPAWSLALIDAAHLRKDDPIIDVGGGASRLVDELLARGYEHVSVLDIAAEPLAIAQARLGPQAAKVSWLVTDIARWVPPPGGYALWHDRAVLHFLTDDQDRAAYLQALNRGLRPGGHVVLATFAPSGPERCSGLRVRRYSAGELQALLGPSFELLSSQTAEHETPGGGSQDFTWCLFRKRDA
jgi:SAM-dependent methyltransferase